MNIATLTFIHVLLSLIGIASGFVVLNGMITGKRLDNWTALFLGTTVATSATGFLFPFDRLLPSHIVGIISLFVLTVTLLARYVFHLAAAWRRAYVITASIALYLNVFVGVVQAFQKIPVLRAAAPTQSEPPFVIVQLMVLAFFAAFGFVATRRFREVPSERVGAL